MGLFDNFSLDNLDDPKNAGLLAMGLSMLAPKQVKTSLLGDIGQSGLLGLQTLAKAKIDERANRQNDLQQLSGAYNLLRQQEFGKMLAANQNGQPYTANPMLPQMEARLGQLAGLGNLSSKMGSSAPPAQSAPPQGPPSAPQMPPQGMAPPSQSPMANPDYQPPMIRPQAPPPQPQGQSMPQGNLGGPAGGIPMQAWLAQDPTGASYMKQLAEDNKPVALRQGDLVGRNPDGTYRSLFQQPQSVPGVLPSRDSNGQVTAFRAAPGFADAAAGIKGTTTTAEKAAEAPFTMVNIPGANRLEPMSNVSPYFQRGPQGQQGQPQGQQGVARVDVTQPSRQSQYFGGGYQGGGLSGPDPVALAGAQANVEAGAKNRQNVMKDDYANLSSQNSNAQTVISRLQTIKQLGPQAITGAQSDQRDFFNGLLSLAHIDAAKDAKTASDLVDKNAAQIALAIGAGANGTDALRSLAQTANPSRHMTLEAMQKAADSLVAPLQMTQAKTQLLTQHFTKGDTASYFDQKQAFERAADPRVWELQSLPAKDQKAYVSNLSPADAQHLLAARSRLRELGAIQ